MDERQIVITWIEQSILLNSNNLESTDFVQVFIHRTLSLNVSCLGSLIKVERNLNKLSQTRKSASWSLDICTAAQLQSATRDWNRTKFVPRREISYFHKQYFFPDSWKVQESRVKKECILTSEWWVSRCYYAVFWYQSQARVHKPGKHSTLTSSTSSSTGVCLTRWSANNPAQIVSSPFKIETSLYPGYFEALKATASICL